ncbi:MAG: response regulator transcription factor [Gallionella sp.]|nr:response regulator transcription factor [Gallionella sp.]
MPKNILDHRALDVVLVVDDIPENLLMLHDALDEAGYTVLVATNGESAIKSARQGVPNIILLDAMMPGMDGFEVCRRLKADYATQHIPVIFMTGLTETEHVVAAFDAGGTDYVTKPLKPPEVLARMASHLQRARATDQARTALDAFGQGSVAIMPQDGALVWQTPLARRMLRDYFGELDERAPQLMMDWIGSIAASRATGDEPATLKVVCDGKQLIVTFSSQTDEGEWLLMLREESDVAQMEILMAAFKLTMREAEVLYWLVKGKTSRDIGSILGTSPRTVNKHLEHVFEKLGVETRTAAAARAIDKIRGNIPRNVAS